MAACRIGTSGWVYSHWRERFYPKSLPQAEWFAHYCRSFDTVEINYTFYRLPQAEVFDHWAQQAPRNFLYAVKASRFLTHMKKLRDPEEPLERLLSRAKRLGKHLGPVLYQLPPGWHRDLKRLDAFCAALPRRRPQAMEFRDPDWLCEETFALLQRRRVALCLHDGLPKHPRVVTAGFTYLRFHGTGQKDGNYSRAALRAWAKWMRDTLQRGVSIYAYFNNDPSAHAVRNALALREMLAG